MKYLSLQSHVNAYLEFWTVFYTTNLLYGYSVVTTCTTTAVV